MLLLHKNLPRLATVRCCPPQSEAWQLIGSSRQQENGVPSAPCPRAEHTNVQGTTRRHGNPFRGTFDIRDEAFPIENAAKSAGRRLTAALTAASAPHRRAVPHSGDSAGVAVNEASEVWSSHSGLGEARERNPAPGSALRPRLFLGSVTQCVAWLWPRTTTACPPPHPHRPSFETKLGPGQTLRALFLLLFSIIWVTLSFLFLSVSFESHLPLCFFSFSFFFFCII